MKHNVTHRVAFKAQTVGYPTPQSPLLTISERFFFLLIYALAAPVVAAGPVCLMCLMDGLMRSKLCLPRPTDPP